MRTVSPIPAAAVLLLVFALGAGAEQSVRPGANRYYLDPDMNVAEWVRRFEGESREVYAERHAIVAALGLSPGMRAADVGAGTGLFVPLLAAAVGTGGRVFAIDIAPAFVAHLRARVREAALTQVAVVRGEERSITLADGSVDLVFMCDVYHHIEYPRSMLASVHRALVPGGRLVVVDFERIPGRTRQWILGHVRAARETVIEEIERAGFARVAIDAPPGLAENYMVAFERR
jgi:SAM-dependent methyltransferase